MLDIEALFYLKNILKSALKREKATNFILHISREEASQIIREITKIEDKLNEEELRNV